MKIKKINSNDIEKLNEYEKDKYDDDYNDYCKFYNENIYILNISNKKNLVYNFRSIKDLLYNYSYIAILKRYIKMTKLNIKVVGIITDNLLYKTDIDTNNIINSNFKLTDKIGDYKIEKNKTLIKKDLN